VPLIGSGWVIGGIAVYHILISHFAVGGGLFLPWAERKAHREGRSDWLEIIQRHSKFFLVLTGVFGAVSGVGIWFAIGLANPEGTSTLIHNFVFAWAIEWVFFLLELTAAGVYYYTWNRVPAQQHQRIGWFYAVVSLATLFIINGILTFMLTPGSAWLSVAGTGREATAFWPAFFNPTFLPSLGLRTLVCLSLAAIWMLVTASRIDGFARPELKAGLLRWTARWLVPAFVLMPLMFLWYVFQVPEAQRGLLELGVSTIGQGVFTQVTRAVLVSVMTSATILAVVYIMALRNPTDFSLGHAGAVLFLALAATAATEQAREMLRKPYVVVDHLFSNGVRRSQVETLNRDGYLTHSPWLRQEERARLADLDARVAVDSLAKAATLVREDRQAILARGELVFRGQCQACHTVGGYRAMRRFLAERDRAAIGNVLAMLHEYREDSRYRMYMPPLVGTVQEIEALGDYLAALTARPQP
jgi:cytochrome bd-type quinol oxidase subunit 1/mono/diheme cytochrome c family protein